MVSTGVVLPSSFYLLMANIQFDVNRDILRAHGVEVNDSSLSRSG